MKSGPVSRPTEGRVTGGSRLDDLEPATASLNLPVVVRGPSSHSGGTLATVGVPPDTDRG